VKKGGFFGDFIPHHSQTGNHLSDREKARDHTPPESMTSQAKTMEVLISPNLGRPTTRSSTRQAKVMEVLVCSNLSRPSYKEFDEPSESYGSFDSPNLGSQTTRTSMSQAKTMEVLICPNLDRLTTRSSTSRERKL